MTATTTKVLLPDAGRAMGMWVLASRGSGKSRLVGRRIVFRDFQAGYPTVVIDPIGGTIQNILDKILRLPVSEQKAAWRRVRYINCAGTRTHVVPFPYLYAAQSPYLAAQRFIELMRLTDPDLTSASMLGYNALKKIGTDVGMALYALGWQFSEAEALLRSPTDYTPQLQRAVQQCPDVEGAVGFLLNEYPRMKPQEREMLITTFSRKIAPLNREPSLRALFAADRWGFSWDTVVRKRQLLLLDFSHVHESQQQLIMLWVFCSLLEWIKLSRPTGHGQVPLSLVCDEVTYMVNGVHPDFVHAFNQLVSITSRNKQLWITIINQEMNQLAPALQQSFITLGTQLYGTMTDVETARRIAERFAAYQPHLMKHNAFSISNGIVLERPNFFSVQEQREMQSRRTLETPAGTFLAGIATHEGELPKKLVRLSIADLDRGQYPDQNRDRITEAMDRLMRRDGIPLTDVLAAISNRTRDRHAPTSPETLHPPASASDPPVGLKRRSRLAPLPDTPPPAD